MFNLDPVTSAVAAGIDPMTVIELVVMVFLMCIFLWYLRGERDASRLAENQRQEALRVINQECHERTERLAETMTATLQQQGGIIQDQGVIIQENARQIGRFCDAVNCFGVSLNGGSYED